MRTRVITGSLLVSALATLAVAQFLGHECRTTTSVVPHWGECWACIDSSNPATLADCRFCCQDLAGHPDVDQQAYDDCRIHNKC